MIMLSVAGSDLVLPLAIELPVCASQSQHEPQWTCIPELVWQMILRAGEWKDVKSLRLTCRAWKAALDANIHSLQPRHLEVRLWKIAQAL